MDEDLNELIFGLDLEWQWRDSQVRLTDKQLLEFSRKPKNVFQKRLRSGKPRASL